MARPFKNPQQQIRAWELYSAQGFSSSAIATQLQKEFEKPVSLRTVEYWMHKFKAEGDCKKALDTPFEWHRMEEYGIPLEASEYLLEMRKKVIRGDIWKIRTTNGALEEVPLVRCPTARQARWWWRIHIAVPGANMERVWDLAQRFVNRELAHEVLGEPLYLADLEGLLAYRYAVDPDDEGARQELAADVAAGYTPALHSITGHKVMLAARKNGGRTAELEALMPFLEDYLSSRDRDAKGVVQDYLAERSRGAEETEDKQEAAPPDQGGLSKS